MTPLERLHMTTMVAGPAADFTGSQLDRMARTAADLLSTMPPVTVTVGRVLYHPEAIMLGVSPAKALLPYPECRRDSNLPGNGTRVSTAMILSSWVPHITVCYSTAHQPAGSPYRRARQEPPRVRHPGRRPQPHRPARPRAPLGVEHNCHHSARGLSRYFRALRRISSIAASSSA